MPYTIATSVRGIPGVIIERFLFKTVNHNICVATMASVREWTIESNSHNNPSLCLIRTYNNFILD